MNTLYRGALTRIETRDHTHVMQKTSWVTRRKQQMLQFLVRISSISYVSEIQFDHESEIEYEDDLEIFSLQTLFMIPAYGRYRIQKVALITGTLNLSFSSFGEIFVHFLLSRINKIDAIFCVGRFWPLRNHVTSSVSRYSLSACKDGGYRI